MILLIHRDICRMLLMELENNSESVWAKVFKKKKKKKKNSFHYVASWYRQPNSTAEDFQLFRDQHDHIKS